MKDSYIEIKSTKGIKNPVVTDVRIFSEKIYWNIRFNIPLNPETVNEDNMDVTDVDGYTLTSAIRYNAEKNAIVISPLEPYKPNSTYILNISERVCSKGNNNLKDEVQIIFQLKGAEIGNFKVLKGIERLNIEIKPSRNAPTPSQLRRYKLPIINQSYNFLPSLGTLIVALAAYFTRHYIVIAIGTLLLVAGIVHIIYQFTNSRSEALKLYNKGAACYNDNEFGDAAEYFDKSLLKNPDNHLAQRGIQMLSSNQYVKY